MGSFFFVLLTPFLTKAEEQSIQQQIDTAKSGETIEITDGNYKESIKIDKPVHLIGSGDVTITQKDSNPAITIQSDDVDIENLSINFKNDNSDSPAMLINGNNHSLKDIKIDTNSYGIQLDEANDSTLSELTIIGNKNELIKNRKHGIDLWESHNNDIHDTRIKHVNDGIYIENSDTNKIYHNNVSHSRYGSHLMFTNNTELEKNEFYDNVSGLYIMGANETIAKHNTLKDNQNHVQSMGLFLFDTTEAIIQNNNILNNRIGIFIEDASDNVLAANHVQGNYTGLQFKGARHNDIKDNSFIANVAQGQASESSDNETKQNYWGDHLGLDLNGDHTSNLAYTVDPFFLNVTDKYPAFQLLFQSPGMVFLEQLISTPTSEQLIDNSPLMKSPIDESDESNGSQLTILLFCISLLILSIIIIYLGVKTNEDKKI